VAEGEIRVLVVEDHPLYRFAIEQALETDPRLAHVSSVGDGVEALEAIAQADVDVVLLDLSLPRLDGLSLLSELTTMHDAPTVVVLSADTRGGSVARAIALGAGGYLSKDLDAKEICEAVCRVNVGEQVVATSVGASARPPAASSEAPR
jgi:DNA-binding NarL/FixJ family response regulator